MRLKKDAPLTRLEKLSLVTTIGGFGWNYARQIQEWRKGRIEARKFTVTVEEGDDIWWPIENWLTSELRVADNRHVTVQSFADDDKLGEFYRDNIQRTLTLEGHSIMVQRIDAMAGYLEAKTPGETNVFVGNNLKDKYVFTAETEAGREAVLRRLNKFLSDRKTGPFFWRQRPWGGFRRMDNKTHRPLDTIILPGDMSERLVADMRRFLESEKEYAVLGIPWHRGYLFHGPPGTGKTSLIQAVCGHVGVDVYFVTLSSVKSDQQLYNLVESLEDGDALILEDVDVYSSTHDRDDEQSDPETLTLDGLLQVTDGAFTPHGAMIFMTTNKLKKLDDALIRPGRCDFLGELGYLDQDQLDRIVRKFVGVPETIPLRGDKVTPAMVIGALKDTMFMSVSEQIEAIRRVVS